MSLQIFFSKLCSPTSYRSSRVRSGRRCVDYHTACYRPNTFYKCRLAFRRLCRSSDEAGLLHTVRGDRLVNAQVHGRLALRTDRTTSLSNPDSRGTALAR